MTIFLKKYLLLKRHNGEGEAGESEDKADTLHISLYTNYLFFLLLLIWCRCYNLVSIDIMGKVGRKTLRNRPN